MPLLELFGIIFEWHDEKYDVVYAGRELTFEEVCSVFFDPNECTAADNRFDYTEHRMNTIGLSNTGKLLVVAWVERDEVVRIITAFEPSKAQQKIYVNAKKR